MAFPAYNLGMNKFFLRTIFQSQQRSRPRLIDKSAKDAGVFKSECNKTRAPNRANSAPTDRETRNEVFDAATAHRASQQHVLEGPAYVTDGDTICIKKTQVRLFGIDAPELNHPYGKQAKWALVRLCKGHRIRAEVTEIDDYGRTVAKCFLPDGRDLSEELVKQGLALDWPRFSKGKYSHCEVDGVRKKLWLADARQKGRMFVWEKFEARSRSSK